MDDLLIRFAGKILTPSELERFLYMNNHSDTSGLLSAIELQAVEIDSLKQEIYEAESSYTASDVDEAFDTGAENAVDKMKTFILSEIVKLKNTLNDAEPAEKFDLLLFGVNDIIQEVQVDDINLGHHY